MKGRRARGIWREKSQTSAIAIPISLINAPFLLSLVLGGWSSGAIRTKILNIFIPSQSQWPTLLATCTPLASAECLVDDNTIGSRCSHESGAIREAGPARVEVESDVGETVAEGAEEERDVSDKPAESVLLSTIFLSIDFEGRSTEGFEPASIASLLWLSALRFCSWRIVPVGVGLLLQRH